MYPSFGRPAGHPGHAGTESGSRPSCSSSHLSLFRLGAVGRTRFDPKAMSRNPPILAVSAPSRVIQPVSGAHPKGRTAMARKTTAHLFHSVNGVVESPNLFQFDAFGPEEG